MDKIARATEKEREALFRNTATKIGMNAAIVEKDFWVCYVLEYLIANDILKTVKQNWEKKALAYGLSRGQIEEMRPAFGLCFE